MRQKIYNILEPTGEHSRVASIYNTILIIAVIASLVPLAFKETTVLLTVLDRIAVTIFIIDYILRLITAGLKYRDTRRPILHYILSPLAIIDFLCILPTVIEIITGIQFLTIIRILRIFSMLRTVKFIRYSHSIQSFLHVLRKQRTALTTVLVIAVFYIFVSALLVYNVEPDTFNTFIDAVYWATISLTTVGYGDIYPVTEVGRIISMLSAFVGIAVVALPTGVITAGYMEEISEHRSRKRTSK